MASHRKSHQRLGSHSRSTPNFATIKEDGPHPPMPSWSPKPKQSRYSPTRHRKPPTFTAGIPSEPVSADEEDDAFSTHSASSFERDLLSRTTSFSDSASASDSEDTNTRRDHHYLSHSRPASSRPSYTRSSSSLGPSAFAPPFYNRPPTPLPPSPSLTSLLRPRPFTSALSPSRPTTPDSSDTEATTATSAYNRTTYSSTSLPRNTPSATTSTAGLVAQSALSTTGPVPRASPKLPTNEYYGFVLYLGSSLAFFLYLLWSYLPTPFLHQLGIYYYPDRWWSLAVPSWLVVALVWTYVALTSYNTGYLTLPLGSLGCLVDEKGRLAVVDGRGRIVKEDHRYKHRKGEGTARNRKQRRKRERERRREREREKEPGEGEVRAQGVGLDWRGLWNQGTDAVMDVPIGGVCEVLYGEGRDGAGKDGDRVEGVDERHENG